MPTQLPTRFTRFELTEEEVKLARQLTTLQRCYLQNLLADCADTRLNLLTDPLNPLSHLQQEAELVGKMTVLDHLLSIPTE